MSTILEITNTNKSLTSLMKAMKASGLEDVLNGKGPFTIFAPVNIAFSNLPQGFDDLVKPTNKQKLSDIMTFHVIAGKNLVTDLSNGQKLKTVNGQELSVTVANDEIRINGAKVLAQNMQGSNGVVHSIDAVNMPVEALT
jgi:uncharacterized surface protein with fasciclin (FAS1) repeats